MRILNTLTAELEPQLDEPAGYRSAQTKFGPIIGAHKMGATVYELPPGSAVCPYHYESEEEWLMVLEGEITLRHPEGEAVLHAGDVTAFKAGPEGAHKTTNSGSAPARLVMFSTNEPVGYCVYPDSNKISFWSDSSDTNDQVLVRRGENLDYYDGEPGGAKAT
jgi:uncharacterized cupin superfamily protein